MEANELRIGNYVSYYVDGEITYDKVKSIYFDDEEQVYRCELQSGRYKAFHTSIKSFKPITLTEELLVKCGFNRTPNKTYINGIQFNLRIDDRVWLDGIGTMAFDKTGQMVVNSLCRGNYICGAVDCLNELQNLYFTLTGKELEVQL